MTLKSAFPIILAALTLPLCAGEKLAVLKLADGTEYKSVEIMGVSPKGVRILHASGAANVPVDQLPAVLQKKYGAAQQKEMDKASAAEAAAAAAKAKADSEKPSPAIMKSLEAAKKSSFEADITISQVFPDGLKVTWLPTQRDPDNFTHDSEAYILCPTGNNADGEKFRARIYPAGRYEAKRAIGGAPVTMRAYTLNPQEAVERLLAQPAVQEGPKSEAMVPEAPPAPAAVATEPVAKPVPKILGAKVYGIAEVLAEKFKFDGNIVKMDVIVNSASKIEQISADECQIFVGDPFTKLDSDYAFLRFPEAGRKKIETMLSGARGRMTLYVQVEADEAVPLKAVGRSTVSGAPGTPVTVRW